MAWGGVTKPARRELRRDRAAYRIWDGEDLLEECFCTSEGPPTETCARVPLRRAWVLDEDAPGWTTPRPG